MVTVNDFEPAIGSENNSIVYFGRLSREKGLATLIEAVKGIPVVLKVIGDGPQREELTRRAKSDGLDNVRFLGYLQGKSLHQEIRNSRFVVVPRRLEQLEENLAAASIDLSAEELGEIDATASRITVRGARYPDSLEQMAGR